jgi:diguanylate cyclase
LADTNQQARNELSKWADCALSHHQDIQRELREVLSAISAAAESVCKRDEKYAKEIGALTGRLGTIAEETDLALLRASLVDCTRSLKSSVARMAEESKASVQQLTTQVKEYRVRLEEAQRESLTDPLTSLANRRAFEKHLEIRIADRKPFYVLMIDLDEFKGVNDSFGHVAGDDLLKQFAAELKSQFAPADMVARLGGDEFIVVMGGNAMDAGTRVDRIRKWALGEYKINTGDQQVKTALKASLGVAEWDGRETGVALLARADQQVYRAKQPGSRARRASSESERRSAAPAPQETAETSHVIR